MKENINEHDKTKQMMDIIRNGFKSKLITEAEEQQAMQPEQPQPTELQRGDDLPEVDGDTISLENGDSEFNSELTKIQDTITPRAEITNFKIYPLDSNVIIEGILMKGSLTPNPISDDKKYSGIYFTFNLANGYEDPELIDVKGNETITDILNKLPGYYENFRNEWSKKLSNEYKPKQD